MGVAVTLDEVIETLKRFPKDFVFERGFRKPHSYRGYYDELAFAPAENITAKQILDDALFAKGETFEGYKGGLYTMGGDTPCHLAEYGSCGEPLTTYFFETQGHSAELASLNAQLNEAREIIGESCKVFDMITNELFPDIADFCDSMGIKEHGDRVRKAMQREDNDLPSRARSFLSKTEGKKDE